MPTIGCHNAYGFIYHSDGWFGHGGGDPGAACRGQRFPHDNAHLIVLCKVATRASELRDSVLQTWRHLNEAKTGRPPYDSNPRLVGPSDELS